MKKVKSEKVDNYTMITNTIIEKLENGVIPWKAGFKSKTAPMNLKSKTGYRGFNFFLLSCQDFESPYWLTFKQAKEAGGNIKKGEKGCKIAYWKFFKKLTGNILADGTPEEKSIPMMKPYTVFNFEQTEGVKAPKVNFETVGENFQPIEKAEKIINEMQNKPQILNVEESPYYMPKKDIVNMPRKESFEKEEYYYSVLFHELGHSTGHFSRLDRKMIGAKSAFKSNDYSKEELIAEMTATFLCFQTGIQEETIDNQASYIDSWLQALKNDRSLLISASSKAQKASDYILNINK